MFFNFCYNIIYGVIAMNMRELLKETIQPNLNKLTMSDPKKKSNEFQKVVVRRILVKKIEQFQLELFTKQQVFHENLDMQGAQERLYELSDDFKQMNIQTSDYEYAIRMKERENVYVKKTAKQSKKIEATSQNRKKNYLLEESMDIPAMVDLGIFSKDGKIIQSKYEKFRQINRFIEMIDDVISKEDKDFYHIVDFGCGKSYLTFIVYYYFTQIKKKRVKIVGMDLKKDVIEHCNKVADKYGYKDLHFICGDIKEYKTEEPIDMIVTLHACDVATDFALFHAISSKVRLIFSVPCCQHEMMAKIENESFLLRHGIIKERISALYTDALRSQLLQACGYEVDVLEYIDSEGSLKNLLLRCKYKGIHESKKKVLLEEAECFMSENNAEIMLYKLLKANHML